jgi:hypothetical protein
MVVLSTKERKSDTQSAGHNTRSIVILTRSRTHEPRLIADYVIKVHGMNPHSLRASARLFEGHYFVMRVSLSLTVGVIRDSTRAKEIDKDCRRIFGIIFRCDPSAKSHEPLYVLFLNEEYTSNTMERCENALTDAIDRFNGALRAVGIRNASVSLSRVPDV